jgi:hypothetical protein
MVLTAPSTNEDLPLSGRWHGRTNWSLGFYRPSAKEFRLYNTLSFGPLQTPTWLDPMSVISTNGRQVFYTNGVPHTNDLGVFRTSFSGAQSFLPLGIFAIGTATTETGGNMFQQLETSGFNLAMLWPTLSIGEAFTAIGARNVKLIPRIQDFYTPTNDTNSKVFAWYMWDEPHDPNLNQLRLRYDSFPTVRPRFHTNVAPPTNGPLCFRSNNSDQLWAQLADSGEATSLDCYPVHEPASGHETFESVADAVTRFRTEPPTNRPLWFTPEAFAANEPAPNEQWAIPTPLQYRASVYTAFVHGATGLIAFARDGLVARSGGNIGITPAAATNYPNCWRDTLQTVPCPDAVQADKDAARVLWNSMAGFNSELTTTMKRPLLSPTDTASYTVDLLQSPNSGTSPIRTLLKLQGNGDHYLIAVNMTKQSLDAVIQLRNSITSTAVQFESRTVTTPLSAIRDAFGPFAVHIYKF